MTYFGWGYASHLLGQISFPTLRWGKVVNVIEPCEAKGLPVILNTVNQARYAQKLKCYLPPSLAHNSE